MSFYNGRPTPKGDIIQDTSNLLDKLVFQLSTEFILKYRLIEKMMLV